MAATSDAHGQADFMRLLSTGDIEFLSYEIIDKSLASAFERAISVNTHIDIFSFTFCTIQSDAFPIIVSSFPRCASLHSLHFSKTEIDHAGVLALASVLPQCETFEGLYFCETSIDWQGTIALSLVLPRCRALQILSFSLERIGNRGIVALANALKQCSNINSVLFKHCNFGDEGAIALAAALPLCPSLRNLTLSGNCISDVGAKAIVKSVIDHKSLKGFSLMANRRMSSKWDCACFSLNRHLSTTTPCAFPMLSIQLQDSFHVPHGLVRTLLFDMLRIRKLRAVDGL